MFLWWLIWTCKNHEVTLIIFWVLYRILGLAMKSKSCMKPHQETWNCLCFRGAILDTKNYRGVTALMIANEQGHKETAEILRRAGKHSLWRGNQGNNLLHEYFKKQLGEKNACSWNFCLVHWDERNEYLTELLHLVHWRCHKKTWPPLKETSVLRRSSRLIRQLGVDSIEPKSIEVSGYSEHPWWIWRYLVPCAQGSRYLYLSVNERCWEKCIDEFGIQ